MLKDERFENTLALAVKLELFVGSLFIFLVQVLSIGLSSRL
jgi:hypothetical protein